MKYVVVSWIMAHNLCIHYNDPCHPRRILDVGHVPFKDSFTKKVKRSNSLVNQSKPLNFPESFSLHWSFPQNNFKVCRKSTSNLSVIEYWLNVQNERFGQRIQKHFSGKTRQILSSYKTFPQYCSFLNICFEVRWQTNFNFLNDWILLQALKMPNLSREYKTIFLGKQDWPGNFPKTFIAFWSFQ